MNKKHYLPYLNLSSKLFLFTVIFFFKLDYEFCFSQITITDANINLEEYNPPAKPDTNHPILFQEHLPNYKKYLGLKIYLPPKKSIRTVLLNVTPKIIDANVIKPIIFRDYIEVKEGYNYVQKVIDSIEFNKISTYLYNAVHIETEYESEGGYFNPKNVNLTQSRNTFDQYYTIVDVLYGQRYKDTLQKIENNYDRYVHQNSWNFFHTKDDSINDYYIHNDWEFFQTSQRSHEVLFLLQNEKGELLYCTSISDDFISVPFFTSVLTLLKGKELIYISPFDLINVHTGLYESTEDDNGNKVRTEKMIKIHEKEIWLCEDVTLAKPSYELTCIMKREGQRALLTELPNFQLLSEYNKQKELAKLDAQSRKRQQIEEANKKATIEKLKSEKFLSYAVLKYGNEFGSTIGKHKVKIGMNKEMCSESWGNPFYINKSITFDGEIEIWHFSYGNELYFKNGILYKIIKLEL